MAEAVTSATGEAADPSALRRSAVRTFLVVDRIGALGGLVLAGVANALFIRDVLLWLVVAAIGILVAALTLALRDLDEGRIARALRLATAGNWLVAFFVALAVPQLWPVMILTVLMPVVLSAPFVEGAALLRLLGGAAVMTALVSAIGLISDDGGILPDLEDELELVLVTGALVVHIVPVALIVWNNSRLDQETLAGLADANVELRSSQSELADSRRRIAEAADGERRRIERDLHDGAQQQLVALGIRLRLLEELTEGDDALHPQVSGLVSGVDEAIEELRRLAHGIYPPLLETQGLGPALHAAARNSGLDVHQAIGEVDRPPPPVERALYFAALEAMTNVAKHAPGAGVALRLEQNDTAIVLTVADDGPGFDIDERFASNGTHNMGDRLAAVGGTLEIASAPGEGTTVVASAPHP